jgi:hypothetical protein
LCPLVILLLMTAQHGMRAQSESNRLDFAFPPPEMPPTIPGTALPHTASAASAHTGSNGYASVNLLLAQFGGGVQVTACVVPGKRPTRPLMV